MIIKTSDSSSIKPFLKYIYAPQPDSHKGQNGKILIIGGSSLFHSASLWAADVASHFTDMVHYSSTLENSEIFLSLKKKFRNGIIVKKDDLLHYVNEDDIILIGPGMMRGKVNSESRIQNSEFLSILKIKHEAEYTYYLTRYLLENFQEKKFVIDAGALQMMSPEWLMKLKTKPILTPHQGEFEKLFGLSVSQLSVKDKITLVQEKAKRYNCIILLKAVKDFISDGERIVVVEGGNAGLTKGGTGDVLASLSASFYAKSQPFESAVLASYVLKKTGDELFKKKEYWYNINNIIDAIPESLNQLHTLL